MNNQAFFKEIGLSIVFSVVLATPAYSKTLSIFPEEISKYSSTIIPKRIEKKANKNFTAITANITISEYFNSQQNQESKNNTFNSTNISELISYLPDKDINSLASHEENLLLLTPISEKQILIDTYYLGNSSFTNIYSLPAEIDNIKFNISENIVKQKFEENSNSIIPNKQYQVVNKDFQNIQENA